MSLLPRLFPLQPPECRPTDMIATGNVHTISTWSRGRTGPAHYPHRQNQPCLEKTVRTLPMYIGQSLIGTKLDLPRLYRATKMNTRDSTTNWERSRSSKPVT